MVFHDLEDSILDSKISVAVTAVRELDITVSFEVLSGIDPKFVAFHDPMDAIFDSAI